MKMLLDGCTAATHVAYAMSEIATIYPITPIASMGETADRWALQGRLNVFGAPMQVHELESELGAAGATHGALAAGALATTFTASQGLLLMIPNMFKIAGELLPAVFHVGTRSIATHALSIFGDHQDVMACRSTGFAMLASATVQETMDLALVAHLAAIEGRVPVLHFFDGWRTSNQYATIDAIQYETIAQMVDRDAVAAFRQRAMNPDHPDTRGTAQNPDVYFQNREAANPYYDAFPTIVQKAMDRVANATGRQYRLFDYYGHPEAEQVAIAIGSGSEVLREAADRLNAAGHKTGVITVRLYRPFQAESLIAAIPPSAKTIIALDRSKEPGSQAEPLLLDVLAAVHDAGLSTPVIGGRYGLGSKDFSPKMALAVFQNAISPTPKRRFTIGINDDLTHLSLQDASLQPDEKAPSSLLTGRTAPAAVRPVKEAIFFGFGSDGTVGATRQAASIISNTLDRYAQAYFNYSAKKSGGYTLSELRIADSPIHAEYSIEQADYVACHKNTYVHRFHVTSKLRPGGIFVLNSPWSNNTLPKVLPARLRHDLALKKARFYNVDASSLAQRLGLGDRINAIMETIFFHLTASKADLPKIITAIKDHVSKAYIHEGATIVNRNLQAIDQAADLIGKPVDVAKLWPEGSKLTPAELQYPATESSLGLDFGTIPEVSADTCDFIDRVARKSLSLEGNSLPVSALSPDGILPPGTTAWEKRCIAARVPKWDPDKCIQCTLCSLVCSHATIRPLMADSRELADAPADFLTKPSKWPGCNEYRYRIQVWPADCTGCGSCAVVCPGHALTMTPIASELEPQSKLLDFAAKISYKPRLMPQNTIQGSQLRQPLLQFSGACGGCGETPYVKLITQLFGERMAIANATGCSSIWGADFPSNAYCANTTSGHGPAWGNSLFEDNAEYGYGIAVAYAHRRQAIKDTAAKLAAEPATPENLKAALTRWIDAFNDAEKSKSAAEALIPQLKSAPRSPRTDALLAATDMLAKKSVWAIGGDGWAYDIGFAGLDHVLAQNIDINILVMDTECYSNTGGQTSKATPLGAVMKYAAHGKRTPKKDLGRMMMTYGNVYVAQVALGANFMQTLNALLEAESYPGPSIVIAYCPCINQGIRTGMSHTIIEQKLAVQAGYWDLYRYDPRQAAQGKTPLTIDSPAPNGTLDSYLDNEDRYADLKLVDPAAVQSLRRALATRQARIYAILSNQQKNNDC